MESDLDLGRKMTKLNFFVVGGLGVGIRFGLRKKNDKVEFFGVGFGGVVGGIRFGPGKKNDKVEILGVGWGWGGLVVKRILVVC